MHLRTPKRYQGRRRRSPFSLRWLWLWILTPLVVYGGKIIYENRTQYVPQVEQALYGIMQGAQENFATLTAPTPAPTPDPTNLIASANDNWAQGRVETATDDYQKATLGAPNDVGVHYRAALGQLMAGNIKEGLAMAERTITANPYSADAWAIRTLALNWDNKPEEAISSGLYALELDPENTRAMAFLAEAYKDAGRGQLALELANRAVDLAPDSYEGYRTRAWVEWELPDFYDYDAALADFQQAHDLAPNLPQTTIDLALIMSVDEYETPIQLLADVVELNPNNSRVLYRLGVFYYRGLGNFSTGSEYFSRCVDASPNNIPCLGLYGRTQLAMENYPKAIEVLTKAIELGTDDPHHHLWLGRSHIALGDCPTAVPILQAGYALAQDQNDTETLTALADELSLCQAPAVPLPTVASTSESSAASDTTQTPVQDLAVGVTRPAATAATAAAPEATPTP